MSSGGFAALAGPIYLDTSALAKLNLHESGSTELNAAIAGRGDIIASDLGLTELVSALMRRRSEGGAAKAALVAHRAVLAQWQDQALAKAELTPPIHREAERLLLLASMPLLRAAGALHLALALATRATTVACYDQRLRSAAAGQGLGLYPA